MKKKLGVIGGMGPEATAYFYEEVIRHTKADCDQEHLDMTILSHAGPDKGDSKRGVRSAFAGDGGGSESYGGSRSRAYCHPV